MTAAATLVHPVGSFVVSTILYSASGPVSDGDLRQLFAPSEELVGLPVGLKFCKHTPRESSKPQKQSCVLHAVQQHYSVAVGIQNVNHAESLTPTAHCRPQKTSTITCQPNAQQ